MLHIPGLLSAAEIAEISGLLGKACWVDGRATAGHLSAGVKRNRQLEEDAAEAQQGGRIVTAALNRSAAFMSAALPARIVPPLFSRYRRGETYGDHIDGAIRHAGGQRIRTDLSATVFLSSSSDYEGGELVIADGSMTHRVKYAAGDMLLYPATTIHGVEPVTAGSRLVCFFWVQSIIREQQQRTMLFDLDRTIQRLTADRCGDAELLALTAHYHNLVRLWADG